MTPFTPEYSGRVKNLSGNAIREIFKLLSLPGMISFAGGMPASDSFAADDLGRIAQELIQSNAASVLQYGQTEGYTPLKAAMRSFIEAKGIEYEDDELLITAGGQQVIDLAMKVLTEKGDTVLVESPTFLGALHTMRTYELNIVGLESDGEGATPESLERELVRSGAKVVYLIPTFQNPSGVTAGMERRKALYDIAKAHNALVIEDDPYRDLRYSGEPVPPMKTLDDSGHVLYAGSFSKIISPGLRVGYCIGSSDLIRKLTIAKQAVDVHTSLLPQAMIAQYLNEGLLPGHLESERVKYTARLGAMLNAARHFPDGVKFTEPEGGLFIWAELPKGINATEMLKQAAERRVAYVPGESFYADLSGKNTMRLNFSNSPPEKIQEGMEILKSVIIENLK